MIAYPLFAGWIGFECTRAGMFVGATTHEAAQVVGPGYSISPPEATPPPSSS
jgi:uncharacterized membrane protein YadS